MIKIMMLMLLMGLAPQAIATPTVDKEYQLIYEKAFYECPYRSPKDVDGFLLWKLVEIEKKFNPPKKLKGMLLAAACRESGYNPKAKGDYDKKGRPRAIGILQQWPWVARYYKIDRTEPLQAADAWMKHIVKQLKYVKKRCKYKTPYRIWRAAWVTAIRAPKKGGRCKEESLHFRLLMKWQKKIKKEKRGYESHLREMESKGEYVPGC